MTSATAGWVSLDVCDGPKFAYWCASPVTSESGNDPNKLHKKLVCAAGDATGKHYLYGDIVAHDITAWTV